MVGSARKEEVEGGRKSTGYWRNRHSPGSRASKLEKVGSDGPRVGHGDDEQMRGDGGNREYFTKKKMLMGKDGFLLALNQRRKRNE